MSTAIWNLWVWNEPSWIVLASALSREELEARAKNAADPKDTWCIVPVGSPKDNYLRSRCTERWAPYRRYYD